MTTGIGMDKKQIGGAPAEQRCTSLQTLLENPEQLATSWHQELGRQRRLSSQPQ